MGHPIRYFFIHLAMILSSHHKSLAKHTFLLLVLARYQLLLLLFFLNFVISVTLQHNSHLISIPVILKVVCDRPQVSREGSEHSLISAFCKFA